MRDTELPGGLEGRSAQCDVVRVGAAGEVDVLSIACVVVEDHQVVEHGEVVAGKSDR